MRIPVAAEDHLTVTVSSDASKLGGEAAKAALLLEEVACPGYSAADCAAEVRGRTLHLSARKEAGGATKAGTPRVVSTIRRSVLLPPAAPAAAVEVVCANGVLRASVPRAAMAPAAAVPVAISDSEVAALPAPPAEAMMVEGGAGQ